MLAYLKLAVNLRDDESFRRVVNKPSRGIGDTSLSALSRAAQSHGCSLFEAASSDDLESFGLKGAAISRIRSFCDMMAVAARKAKDGDAHSAAVSIASESGLYLFYKSDTSIEGQSRAANVQELLDSAAAYMEEVEENNRVEGDGGDVPVVTLADFLENISLLSNVDVAEDETNNKVALMTVHSAKGLEFPYVFVSGMEENLFPSGGWSLTEKDLEEERRLFYVALTRAKRAVVLTFAQTRMRNGKHESNSPSRFLREIAPQYLQNPLRKDDFLSRREEDEDSGDSGFRWSRPRFQAEKRPERPSAGAASREQIKAAIAARPKPPVIPDAGFVPDPMSSFHVGDRVEHNRFGAGKVLEITGQAPELKAKITFDSYGEKLLLLKFAKIRHI